MTANSKYMILREFKIFVKILINCNILDRLIKLLNVNAETNASA